MSTEQSVLTDVLASAEPALKVFTDTMLSQGLPIPASFALLEPNTRNTKIKMIFKSQGEADEVADSAWFYVGLLRVVANEDHSISINRQQANSIFLSFGISPMLGENRRFDVIVNAIQSHLNPSAAKPLTALSDTKPHPSSLFSRNPKRTALGTFALGALDAGIFLASYYYWNMSLQNAGIIAGGAFAAQCLIMLLAHFYQTLGSNNQIQPTT